MGKCDDANCQTNEICVEIDSSMYGCSRLHRIKKELLVGHDIDLHCPNPDGDKHRVVWKKAGSILEGRNKAILRLPEVKLDDSGEYTCENGPDNAQFNLIVESVRLEITSRPENVFVLPGSTVDLTYKVKVKSSDPLFYLCEWKFQGQRIWENMTKIESTCKRSFEYVEPSLSLKDVQDDQTGNYSLTVTAKDRKKEISRIMDKSSVTVAESICKNESPCSPMGECQDVKSDDGETVTFECICDEGFEGKTCKTFNPRLFGMKGKTYFYNQNGELNVDCHFGKKSKRYTMVMRMGNESHEYHEDFISHMKVDKKKHDNAVVECMAELSNGHKSITLRDSKTINFLKEYSYGERVKVKTDADTNARVSKWRQNGILHSDSMDPTLEFPAESTPGVLQALFYGQKLVEKYVVCPSALHVPVFFGVFSILNLLFSLPLLWKMCFVTPVRSTQKSRSTSRGSNIFKRQNSSGSAIHESPEKNLREPKHAVFGCFKTYLKCFWRWIMNAVTFVTQLCLLELITTLSYILHKDVSWGAISAGALLIEYGLRWSILSWFFQDQKMHFSPATAVRAFFNQAVPILMSYTRKKVDYPGANADDEEIENMDQGGNLSVTATQKAKSLSRIMLCQSMRSFVFFFLNAYIIAYTLGMNSICLPDFFDSSSWSTNFAFELKSSDESVSEKVLKLLFNISDPECNCRRWESDNKFCLSSVQTGSAHGCSVADCYSKPSWAIIAIPLVLSAKSLVDLSWKFAKDLNPAPLKWPFQAVKLIYMLWVLISCSLLTLFGHHQLNNTYQEDVTKITLFLSILCYFRLITPLHFVHSVDDLASFFHNLYPHSISKSVSEAKQRSLYLVWYCVGSLQGTFFFLFAFLANEGYSANGCLMDVSRNRLTFMPVTDFANNTKTRFLYYSSPTDSWDDVVKQKYTKYRVIPMEIQEDDPAKFCGKNNCQLYNTRFENDNLIWLFKYIGYLAAFDCGINAVYSLVVWFEFDHMLDSDSTINSENLQIELEPHSMPDVEQDSPLDTDICDSAVDDIPVPSQRVSLPGHVEVREILEKIALERKANKGGLPPRPVQQNEQDQSVQQGSEHLQDKADQHQDQ